GPATQIRAERGVPEPEHEGSEEGEHQGQKEEDASGRRELHQDRPEQIAGDSQAAAQALLALRATAAVHFLAVELVAGPRLRPELMPELVHGQALRDPLPESTQRAPRFSRPTGGGRFPGLGIGRLDQTPDYRRSRSA